MPKKLADAPIPNIYIVGPNFLKNQLLALWLGKELKVECACLTKLTVKDIFDKTPERMRVFLLDWQNLETTELDKCLETVSAMCMDSLILALFDVDPSFRIGKLVHRHKVRGIFYQNDSRQVFLKGMGTILKGNLWLSRRILSEYVFSTNKENGADGHAVTPLSDREKEVLRLIAMGFSNDEIAEKMRPSHTPLKDK